MKIEYQCSNCGKWEKVSAMVGIPHGMFALGYRAVGDALYCPDCVNSWEERNGKPFDEQYKNVGHMFAEWWNATVLKKAKAEHKQLKKYGVNEIGWYEDRGEVESPCDTCAMYYPNDGCMAGLVEGEVAE